MAIDLKKIDKQKLIILGAAVAAGIVAIFLTNTYVNQAVEKGSTSKVVLSLESQIKSLQQENADIRKNQEALFNNVRQELANQRQQPAQPAQAQEIRRQSLALKTPPGKRAITVNITTLAAVGGLINPGDFVDVLVHLALPEGGAPATGKGAEKTTKTTVTLFQNIQVLAVGANVGNPADFEGQQKTTTLTITFAVDPQQAEIMAFAESYGKLQLVLRSPGEKTAYKLPSGNWETFTEYLKATQGVAIEPPVVLKKPEIKQEPAPEIRVYRGGAK